MKWILTTCALGLALAGCASSEPMTEAEPPMQDMDTIASTETMDGLDGLPPLLDRNLFFGDPEIAGAQLSPDGRFITFRKPYRDVMNLWIKGIDEPFDAARPLTDDVERPVSNYFWSQDSRYVLYIQDKGGNENYHVYVVDPTTAPEADTGVPPARNVTPFDGARALIYAVPEPTPNEILVGLNDRDARWHDVYRLDLTTGERTLLLENDGEYSGFEFDLDGNLRLASRTTTDGSTEILRVDGDDLTSVYTCSVEEACYPLRFHKDGERVYMVTNKGDRDLTALVLFDPETLDETFVEDDPEGQVDFGGAEFSDVTDELVATYYLGDRLRIYPKNDEVEEDLATLREKLPEGEIYFGSATEDETKMLVSVQRDVDPGSVYLFDRASGDVDLLYRSRPELPTEHLAPMQAIRYEARDGLEIPAYLTLPKGVEPKNLPTVIFPHGGPWSRDQWGYNAFAQFLANRGYAVLAMNFRGSTGYGKAFLNAGNKGWGTGAMQHDITDGVQYLMDQGIADPDRIAIMGGSYGGYATLAGLTFTPDLYAAGVDLFGPANLNTLLNTIPPYWASIKRVFNVRVGNPDDPDDEALLKSQSPFFFADRIRVPLLVYQGANDPRVKQAESDQIVVAARDNGVDVEYLIAPDEGHSLAVRENRLAVFARTEAFLADHLGGRYQPEMEEAVAQKLADLTIDVSTVTLPEAPAMDVDPNTAPLPEANGAQIAPTSMEYATQLNINGRQIDLEMTRTVEAATLGDRPVWRIVDATKLPPAMGGMTAVDTFEVDKTTMVPLRRNASGLGTMALRYSDAGVEGEIGGVDRMMPVSASLDAPVFGDGPGFELTIAALPLEMGYEAIVRQFSPMQQQIRPARLTVTGEETVETPAGSYATYVVEVRSLDGDDGGDATLHVTRTAPHHVVKGSYKLPAMMGGGTMTNTLTSMGSSGSN